MNISKSENLQIVHFITRPTIFVVILEYIENGLIVGEILLITIKSEQKMFWTAVKRITNKKKLTNIPPIFDNAMTTIVSGLKGVISGVPTRA